MDILNRISFKQDNPDTIIEKIDTELNTYKNKREFMNVDYQKDLDAFNLKYKDFVITSDLLTGNLLIDKQKELDIMKKEKQELQIKVNNYYIMVGNLNSLEERKKSLIEEFKIKC